MPALRSRCLLWKIALVSLLLAPAAYLNAQATTPMPGPRSGSFRIAGTITSAREGYPLSRARVSLRDVKNPQYLISMITGDDGRFEFSNLPAGKYSLLGAKRGYITCRLRPARAILHGDRDRCGTGYREPQLAPCLHGHDYRPCLG